MRSPFRGLATLTCLVACAPALATGSDLVAGPSVTSSERSTAAAFASVFAENPAGGRAQFTPIAFHQSWCGHAAGSTCTPARLCSACRLPACVGVAVERKPPVLAQPARTVAVNATAKPRRSLEPGSVMVLAGKVV